MTKNIIVFLLLAVFCTACNTRPKLERPEGMPELHPCFVTVTFGGNPVDGVAVTLIPEKGEWKSQGLTDKDGIAKPSTSYGFKGIPTGTYTIAFSKIIHTADDSDPSIPENKSLIPLKYGPDQSKEKVEIKDGEKNEFSYALDAGEEFVPKKKNNRY